MRPTLLLTLMFILVPTSHAADGWYWVSPLPQGNNLYDVQFVSDEVGFCAGVSGAFLCTEDGGTSWQFLPVPKRPNIGGIHFQNELRGTLVGGERSEITSVPYRSKGVILQTTTGGRIWQRMQVPFCPPLNAVVSLDESIGVAVGDWGVILRTMDSGAHWTAVDSHTDRHLLAVAAADDTTLVVVGGRGPGIIVRSSDRGLTWELRSNPSEEELTDVCFLTPSWGIAVGSGDPTEILLTEDGGINWRRADSIPPRTYLNTVVALGPDEAIAAGNLRDICHTQDGGETWITVATDVVSNLYALDATPAGEIYGVGSVGAILSSTDGGVNWRDHRTFNGYGGRDLDFADALFGMTVYGSSISRTMDGGLTWNVLDSGTSERLFGISVVDQHFACASGESGTILWTDDGGQNWNPTETVLTGRIVRVSFGDTTHGIAIDPNNLLLYTNDGGRTWSGQPWPEFDYLQDALMISPSVGFVTTYYGRILRSDDGGESWSERTYNPVYSLDTISFSDEMNGIAADGYDGRFLITTEDGGWTWQIHPVAPPMLFNDIWLTDPATMTGVGDGTVQSKDGGNTWSQQESPYFSLESLHFLSDQVAVATGSGRILRTETAGEVVPTYAEAPIPARRPVFLAQNHPNPFNPRTTITYSIPQAGHVELEIYDLAGRHVSTLVSKHVGMGEHQVHWNGKDDAGAQMASGVYLYQLRAGDFTETKRMVLLK